jgi:hypothetical protein
MVKKSPKNDRLNRDIILEVGALALISAKVRLESKWTSRVDRLAWSRITASLVSALSGCLKDAEVEVLEARLKVVEERLKENGEKD